jgi:PAS domain S-box-containing protein
MFRYQQNHVVYLAMVVFIATAILQLWKPGTPFFDAGFIIAVVLTVFIRKNIYTWLLAAGGLILVLGTGVFLPGPVPEALAKTQHIYFTAVLAGAVFLVLYIKKIYQRVAAEDKQITALFEYATEGIVLCNEQGVILLANPAAETIFGFERNELQQKTIEILLPDRFKGGHANLRAGFAKNPSSRSMGQGRDLFARRKDGSEFPVEISLSFYKENKALFIVAFIVDITLRKAAEQKTKEQKEQLEKVSAAIKKLNGELETKVEERTLILRETLHQLERSQEELSDALQKEKELSEIKSRFVSMASHEFRTPLSTILSSAALINKYPKEEQQENREKHITKIKDSVKHLNDLLEDFLSLGKLEDGKVAATISAFDAKETLEDITDELKPLLKKGQQITFVYTGNNTFITDKRLLKNILLNLLSNAIKFSPEETAIELIAFNETSQLKITVADKGIGISKEDQEYLFSSFFRGKNAINIQGTGLGLHIVKRYADLIDAEVQVESEINCGTTFSLTVPAAII